LGRGNGASTELAAIRGDADVAPVDARRERHPFDDAAGRAARSALAARTAIAAVLAGSAARDSAAGVVLQAERGGAGIDWCAGVPFVATARNEFARAVDRPFIAAAVGVTVVHAQAEIGELDDADALHTIVRISDWELAIVVLTAIGVHGAISSSADALALGGAERAPCAARNRIAGVVVQTIGRGAGIDRLAFGVRFATVGYRRCAAYAIQAAIARADIAALAILDRIGADPVDACGVVRYEPIAIDMRRAIGVAGAAGDVRGYANARTIALAALLIRGTAGFVADHAPRGAAEFFAVACAVAAGVIATDADASIAAFGTACVRSGRTGAGGAIPGLAAGAFQSGGRGCWPAGGLSRPQSGAGGQSAETKQALENRAATLSTGKRAHERVKSTVIQRNTPGILKELPETLGAG
jgi:hypothetical protein